LFYTFRFSAGLIVALLAGCLWLPNIDHATVALLMVAAVVGLATWWGTVEALTGALTGGIGFDFYFLPPRGFGIEKPGHLVALIAFLLIALAIGQLAARSKQLLAQRDSSLHLSLDPLCIGDLNGRFRSVNQAMVQLLGWSERELCSRPFLEFVHPDDQARTKAAFRDFSAGRSVVDIENRYRTKDGGWRILLTQQFIAERVGVRNAVVNNWNATAVANYVAYGTTTTPNWGSSAPGLMGLTASEVTLTTYLDSGIGDARYRATVAGVPLFTWIPYMAGKYTAPTIVATAPVRSQGATN
jgi:PAS domain S-box-containing protein